jgi:hypothetical protein
LWWWDEVLGGGTGALARLLDEPAVVLIEMAGELFVDGGSGKALGVVMVEVLDSAGE